MKSENLVKLLTCGALSDICDSSIRSYKYRYALLIAFHTYTNVGVDASIHHIKDKYDDDQNSDLKIFRHSMKMNIKVTWKTHNLSRETVLIQNLVRLALMNQLSQDL